MRLAEAIRFYWFFQRRFDAQTRKAWALLKDGSTFLDVGANVGLVSLAARATGATVHSIEPNPWAFAALESRTKRDNLIHTWQFAASTLDGTVPLFLHEEHTSNPTRFSTGSSLLFSKPNVSSDATDVPSRDLATFISNLGHVDFLKIDIEGYEVDLVPHLVERLNWSKIGFVAVEIHGKGKWAALQEPTVRMRKIVADAALNEKFSWNWP